MARTLVGSLFNRAATAAANTPVPFASRGQTYGRGIFGASRGVTSQLDAMGSVSTLFAIVNRTAKAEAGVEWGLFRKAKSGKKEDRTPVVSHAALDLWNKPNRFYTQSEFVEAGAQHKQLTGEQWWVIGRVEGVKIPLEMWPVRPDRIQPVPDPDEFLLGYMYTGPDGQQVALGIDDVIFIRTPHPTDPYRGIGPVQALLTDLDAVRYSAEWNRNFFLNSAEPGGIIEVPGGLSEPDFNELRERWSEQHKGVANAHRVAILEHGKWVDRKFSQRDMQFVELRDVGREIIREAFGFPKSMTGASEDVNRANAEAGEVMFARWLCVPDLEAVKDALNHRLLPMFGHTAEGLEFDYVNPVPEDAATEAATLTANVNAAAALISAGAYGPAALEAFGLPEIQFGAPDADPSRELLISLVKAAPAALADRILPMLGYDLPVAPVPAEGGVPAVQPANAWDDAVAGLLGADVEAAMRWEAVAHIDENTCQPCADNDGAVYRNRAAAYKDYPGGSGYVKCVGAEHGNDCRCKVVKRKKTRDDE
ncbi:phage portal protein [Streptomyces sp. SAS_275]|uniref:phage portal protein n=1 Tax=Streptomyces sp. SAS_275 TaxID=3412746 RepID=UPI00403CD4A9